jgi:carboxymethylenebutenolidase
MPHRQPQGFLASPRTSKGRGVLVLHPWWGLNDAMRAFCAQLAEVGFVAFAADLYHGKVAATIEDAESLSNTLDSKQAKTDIADAAAFSSERVALGRHGLAVIGFSLGAYYALDLSLAYPERIRAVVVFYGTRAGDYSRSKAQYLGHFAETDEYESESDVNGLEEALRGAGRPVTFYHYQDSLPSESN